MPAKARLLRWGAVVGLNHGVASHLMFLLKDHRPEYLVCLVVVLVHFVFSLPGLLPRSERQVDWYRRSVFVPLALPWGIAVLAKITSSEALLGVSLLAVIVAVFVAPLVWLTGAVWLWSRYAP